MGEEAFDDDDGSIDSLSVLDVKRKPSLELNDSMPRLLAFGAEKDYESSLANSFLSCSFNQSISSFSSFFPGEEKEDAPEPQSPLSDFKEDELLSIGNSSSVAEELIRLPLE